MAKFPVYQTDRSLPGTTGGVRASLDTDVGGRQLAVAGAGLGQAVASTAGVFYRLQGESELVQANAQNKKAVDAMLLEMDRTDNPEEFAQIFDETFGAIEARELSNGYARRQYRLGLPGYRANLEGVVERAKFAKAAENYTNAASILEADAKMTGNMKPYADFLRRGAAQFGMSSWAEKQITEVRHAAAQQKLSAYAQQNPDKVLEWTNEGQMRQAVPFTVNTDLTWVQGVAQGVLHDRARDKNERQRQASMGVWQYLLGQDATAEGAINQIKAIPNELVDPDAKFDLIETVNRRAAALAKGEPDPLRVRQDYGAYRDLVLGTVDGAMTEADWRQALNAGRIAMTDYEHGVKMLEGEATSVAEGAALKYALSASDKLMDGIGIGMNLQLVETAKIKVHKLLTAKIEAAKARGKPLTDDEMLDEAIRLQRQVQNETITKTTPEELLPIAAIRTPGTVARLGSGQEIGTYTADGKILLSIDGVRALRDYAKSFGWDQKQAEAYAERKGYVIP